VVLLHDGAADGEERSATVDALLSALPALAGEGYSFVTVSTLLEQALSMPRTLVSRHDRPESERAELS
jgi:peptidoglycan/xylan/chitin deacetylase (PgdA/CDA1 family)